MITHSDATRAAPHLKYFDCEVMDPKDDNSKWDDKGNKGEISSNLNSFKEFLQKNENKEFRKQNFLDLAKQEAH